jgi:hypothetical protein
MDAAAGVYGVVENKSVHEIRLSGLIFGENRGMISLEILMRFTYA